MQRKATKQSPAPSAIEKKFMMWVHEQPCIECGNHGVIAEHCYGSTFRHNKVHIGHWAILPLCEKCDSVKTQGSHRAYLKVFKHTQSQAWEKLIEGSKYWAGIIPPYVKAAIYDWGR